jgi:hypothetical protein
MRRTLYGQGAQAVFYKVTPTAGETVIATLTSGFFFVREKRAGQEIDGSGVKMWLDAGATDRPLLHYGGVVALTAGGITTRYSIVELLPQQQLGAGYVLRLTPLTGATE